MLRFLFSCSLPAVLCCGATDLAVAADMPAVRNVELRYTCEMSDDPAGAKNIEVWLPVVTSNDRQTVQLRNEAELTGGQFTTDKKFGNRIYYRRYQRPQLPKDKGDSEKTGGDVPPIKIELVYEIQVHERTVPAAKNLIASRQVTPGPEMAPYLGSTAKIPIEGRLTELAQSIDLAEGEPLRAGRKIYDFLVDTMVYNYQAPGAGSGDAVWACDSKTGDCTDYHSVFIGVCRWRGIPADHVFGLPIPPDKPEGPIKYCHCWARYWVADVGWIPIDASRADKFPADREYYFGTLGSTWITLAHGRDVVLDPPQHGAPINMFEAPYAEIDGQPTKGVKWQAYYKDLPTRPGAASATK